jgi:hypothetical protein
MLAAWWTVCARDSTQVRGDRPTLMLFTSLPIYWAEAVDVAGMIGSQGPPHWARRALEVDHALLPLDALDAQALKAGQALLLAQPRPLAPSENVALDAWVRGGGRVLLFADPALTAESKFAIGDTRRPQDIALLSPILARWGLELTFDDSQPLGERLVRDDGTMLPVNLPGRFVLVEGGSACRLAPGGLIARCRIGAGQVTAVADAALLETPRQSGEQVRREALKALVDSAFMVKWGI